MTPYQIKFLYRRFRRRGYAKGQPTLNAIFEMHARLAGSFAIMEATKWEANPLQLAKNAAAV